MKENDLSNIKTYTQALQNSTSIKTQQLNERLKKIEELITVQQKSFQEYNNIIHLQQKETKRNLYILVILILVMIFVSFR